MNKYCLWTNEWFDVLCLFPPVLPSIPSLGAQSCPTLCNSLDYRPSCSSAHGNGGHHVPLSQQEYWSGLLFPSPRDLPDPGVEPESPVSPALQVDSLPLSFLMKAKKCHGNSFMSPKAQKLYLSNNKKKIIKERLETKGTRQLKMRDKQLYTELDDNTISFFFFFFWLPYSSMWDLSSLNKDKTLALHPCIGSVES